MTWGVIRYEFKKFKKKIHNLKLRKKISCLFGTHEISKEDEIKVTDDNYIDTKCLICKYPLRLRQHPTASNRILIEEL